MEEVTTLLEVELADRPELLLYADQLINDVVRLVYLLLEDLDSLGYVLGAASIRSCRAVSATFTDATLSCTAEGSFHAQVLSILSSLIFVGSVISEKWIQKVTCQSLCPSKLVITGI